MQLLDEESEELVVFLMWPGVAPVQTFIVRTLEPEGRNNVQEELGIENTVTWKVIEKWIERWVGWDEGACGILITRSCCIELYHLGHFNGCLGVLLCSEKPAKEVERSC